MTNKQIACNDRSPFAQRAVWLGAFALAAAFFCNEHSVHTSEKIAFTLTADEMVSEAGGGNSLRRISFMSLSALGVGLFMLRRQATWKGPTPLAVGLLTLLAYCVLSTAWSVDPGMTIRRLFVLGLAFIAAVGMGSAFRFRELCAIVLLATGTLTCLGLMCELALGTFRPWAGDYRFSGSVHPNTQGVYLAAAAFTSLCLSRIDSAHRRYYFSILGLALCLLVLTKSRTSTAGVLVVLGLQWWLMSNSLLRVTVPAVSSWLIASGLLLALLAGADVDRYVAKVAFMGREEQTESFSGRTTIWPVVTHYIHQHYWFGHGYDSFWTPPAIAEVTFACEWPVREAHSSYYETLLHLGMVGLCLLLSVSLCGWLSCLWQYVRWGDLAVLPWFAMILNGWFNGIFESAMTVISLPTFCVAVGLVRLAFFRESSPKPQADADYPPREDRSVNTSLALETAP